MNNMNKIQYILLLLALTLAGCHSYLSYNGPTEPEKLVLHCEWYANSMTRPIVHLSHSFFMREANNDSSYVNDATVEFRVGDGEWQTMTCVPSQGYYLPAEWEVPKPGERVEIRASHPNYEPVSSVQYAPYPIEVTEGKINGTDKNGLVSFSLTLPAYEGPSTDVIGIRCHGLMERTGHYWGNRSKTDTINIETIYSLDPVFGRLNNLRSKSGYYGSRDLLYLPADALREPRTIDFYADYADSGNYGNITFTYQVRFLWADLRAGTEDFYRYENSIRMRLKGTNLIDPHGIRMDDDYGDIEEEMNEIANVLGGQEPVIIHNNIKGGIGHFSAYTFSIFHVK